MQNNPAVDLTSPQAKKYQAMKNRLFILNLFLQVSFLVFLVVFSFSLRIKMWSMYFVSGFLWVNAVYLLILSMIGVCLFFPLDYYEGFVLEHKFGLSKETFFAWLKDFFKKGIIGFIFSVVLIEAVYFFLLKFYKTWWLWAAIFYFFLSVVISRIFPKFILPLFYKSRALEEGVLREKIFALLSKFNVKLKQIYVLDFSKKTVKANAMVAGLGRTKQIYLSDTLVSDFPVSEVELVLAHELGHYTRRDTLKISIVGLVGALVSFRVADLFLNNLIPFFGFQSLSDIAGLPLFLLVLIAIGLILLPLNNAFLRFIERQADLFALKATNDTESFISMMRRLGEKNFADFTPSKVAEFFLYDHPPIGKRIDLAKKFASGAL